MPSVSGLVFSGKFQRQFQRILASREHLIDHVQESLPAVRVRGRSGDTRLCPTDCLSRYRRTRRVRLPSLPLGRLTAPSCQGPGAEWLLPYGFPVEIMRRRKRTFMADLLSSTPELAPVLITE
jgi:hypothetical protein